TAVIVTLGTVFVLGIGGLVIVVGDDVIIVLFVFVLVEEGVVVDAVIQNRQVQLALRRNEVLVGFGAFDMVFALSQRVVDLYDDLQATHLFQTLQIVALVVQDIDRHCGRDAQGDATGTAATGFDFNSAQGGQRGGLCRTDTARTLTA